MKRILWVLGGAAFLLLLYFTALPGDLAVGRDSTAGLAGTYTVNGTDPTGLEYSGTLVIAENDDGTFDMEWIVTGLIARGVGVRSGNELAVEWQTTSAASDLSGSASYVIRSDGTLTGTRFIDGNDEPGIEEVFPDA